MSLDEARRNEENAWQQYMGESEYNLRASAIKRKRWVAAQRDLDLIMAEQPAPKASRDRPENRGPTEEISIPDGINAIRGYRLWFAPKEADHSYRALRPTGHRDIAWPPREPIEARCLPRKLVEVGGGRQLRQQAPCGASSPAPGCTCGVYIAKSPSIYDGMWPFDDPFRDVWSELGDGLLVLGEVEGWGRVIQHEKGWRAQYARPVSLVFPAVEALRNLGMRAALEQLADRYEVPVVDEEEFGLVQQCNDRTCQDLKWPRRLWRAKRPTHRHCSGYVLFCTRGWLV